MQGISGKRVATVTGYAKLAQKIEALAEEVQQAKGAIKSSKSTVDSLLADAKVSLVSRHHMLLRCVLMQGFDVDSFLAVVKVKLIVC